ncbi:MAG: glycoside hydrolase family 130 protein [Sphingorhabdus sp.]
MLKMHQSPLRLRADPSRVVLRPFHLAWNAHASKERMQDLVEQVRALDMRSARSELGLVFHDFESRHLQTQNILMKRYVELEAELNIDGRRIREEKKLLIGAYFCHEYSYAAAALMNPSVTPHPDQGELSDGYIRVLLSLRAVGEGHISTIAFREGIVTTNRKFELVPQPKCAMAADNIELHTGDDGNYISVFRSPESSISGTVIFPVTDVHRNGLEDLRLTRFEHDDGMIEWIGTYTAYSGREIRSELLRTSDFSRFDLFPLEGPAARNKGLALFPRAFEGMYLMIGRHDGKNLYLIKSDTLGNWGNGELLLEPRYPWELVQIGNCGPPIEIDEGWLLLTHGVGAIRKYSIGAVLLDKSDPSRILGRTTHPILSSADEDREGYVPNVVYSCGGMRVGDDIFLPYGVADSSIAFAFLPIKELLASMQ